MGYEKDYSTRKPNDGIEIVVCGNELIYAGPLRRGMFIYIKLILLVTFVITFFVSGYFVLGRPLEYRLEVLVAPLTMVTVILTNMKGKVRLFLPTFIIGMIWSAAALISTSVSFDVAYYVFFYCIAIALLLGITIMKQT